MILAIVGSRTLAGSELAYRLIHDEIEFFYPSLVMSGGALGIDTMAEEIAAALDIETDIKFPLGTHWPDYQARNNLIAKECDTLVCIKDPASKTDGCGYTARKARSIGKRVHIIACEVAGHAEEQTK